MRPPRILDISPTLHPGIAVFPGDTPYSREVALSILAGDNIELSSVRTTVHVGAHTDAPNHYAADGEGIDTRPLELYYGPCEVRTVDLPRGSRVRPKDLIRPPLAPRFLLRTRSMPDPDLFNEDFVALSAELIDWLHGHGVRLVGLDTPSIDPAADAALESHAAVARHDMAILEGVVLDGVEDGLYTLIALPLKLRGADASPVRAVLVDL